MFKFLKAMVTNPVGGTSVYIGTIIRNSCSAAEVIDCWNCKHQHHLKLICPSCDAVQCTDCTSKKLSYFKLLNSDERYQVDLDQIKKFYIQLQSLLHPDRFVNKTDLEQQYSSRQSALVGEAYTTLRDPIKRGVHLLELQNEAMNTEAVDSSNMNLLSEVFALNFQVNESDDVDELNKLLSDVANDIQDDVRLVGRAFDEESNLNEAKDLLVKLNYLTNVKKRIEDKLLVLSFN